MERLLLVDATHRGSRVIAVGDRGYIVLSDDNGKTWRRAKSPAAPLLTAVEFLDAKSGWAVGHDSVILATDRRGRDLGRSSSPRPPSSAPSSTSSSSTRTPATRSAPTARSTRPRDGGKSWNPRKVIDDDKHLNAFVRAPNGHLVILGEAGTILLSPDAGKTWSAVPSPYKGSLFGGLVADDGAVVAFGLRGRIFRSTDAGRTWKPVDNASDGDAHGRLEASRRRAGDRGRRAARCSSRATTGSRSCRCATGSTKAFAKAVLGPPNAVILLGETGAREVALPSAKR